jgi:putative ABC transport system substrate-binding protein
VASILLAGAVLAVAVIVEAQQAKKITQIGFLSGASALSMSERVHAFRQELSKRGYVEGTNLLIESRYADGKPDRLRKLVAEMVGLNTEVIVSGGPVVTHLLKQATSTIPIIMTQDSDPVASGMVASLARPGGNITGVSSLSPEIAGKRLELLRDTIPRLSRVVLFGTATRPGTSQELKELEFSAGIYGVNIQFLEVNNSKDIESGFQAASNERADAILLLGGPVVTSQRRQLIELARKSRLPVIHFEPEYVEDGGLMSYSTSVTDLFRRAAIYADKILKGAKPADLAVEQPTKFELVINLKAAKQIGLMIPPNVLARADKVIK